MTTTTTTTKAEKVCVGFEKGGKANDCNFLESFGHQRRKGRVGDWYRSPRRLADGPPPPKRIDQSSEDVVFMEPTGLVDRRPSELPAKGNWEDPTVEQLHSNEWILASSHADAVDLLIAPGQSGNADPHSA